MSNYAVWNVRLRHEWLATPLKKKRIKRRAAKRVGLLDALQRNGRLAATEAETEAADDDTAADAS